MSVDNLDSGFISSTYENGLNTQEKISAEKKQSFLNETSNDLIFSDRTVVSAMENETLGQQTNGQHNDFDRSVDSASENHIIEKEIDDKIRKAVDNAVLIF